MFTGEPATDVCDRLVIEAMARFRLPLGDALRPDSGSTVVGSTSGGCRLAWRSDGGRPVLTADEVLPARRTRCSHRARIRLAAGDRVGDRSGRPDLVASEPTASGRGGAPVTSGGSAAETASPNSVEGLQIRPIAPRGQAALADGFEHLAAEPRYRRFMRAPRQSVRCGAALLHRGRSPRPPRPVADRPADGPRRRHCPLAFAPRPIRSPLELGDRGRRRLAADGRRHSPGHRSLRAR